jgi:hypothetical protein
MIFIGQGTAKAISTRKAPSRYPTMARSAFRLLRSRRSVDVPLNRFGDFAGLTAAGALCVGRILRELGGPLSIKPV